MKILKQITLLVVLISFSFVCYSHGSTSTRSKCKWYAKKYKAYARVNNGPGLRIQTTSGCGGTYVAQRSYDCVWQKSTNSWGSSSFSGAVTQTPWLCGRGYENSDLYYTLIDTLEDEGVIYEEAEIKHGTIQFNPGSVTIPNIDGSMMTNGKDVFSSLEITVWKPEDDSIAGIADTIVTESKILWNGKIELINGEVTLYGKFPSNSYQLIDNTPNGHTLVFNSGLTIVADFPEDFDDIEVLVTSDGGQIEDRSLILKREKETEIELSNEFSIFPNPSSEEVKITYTPKIEGKGSVKMYDSMGKFVAEVYNGVFHKGENTFPLKLSDTGVEKGLYFIIIEDNNKKHVKRMIYSE